MYHVVTIGVSGRYEYLCSTNDPAIAEAFFNSKARNTSGNNKQP